MSDQPKYFYRVIGSRVVEVEIKRLTPMYVFCAASADSGYSTRFKRTEVEFDKLQAIRVAITQNRNIADQCIERAKQLNHYADVLTSLLLTVEEKK